MRDIRAGHFFHVDASTDGPRHEEQIASPPSPRAMAQGPAALSPRRGASTSGSQEVPTPEQPRMRMQAPSHRQEIAEASPPETRRTPPDWMHSMPESRRFDIQPSRLRPIRQQHEVDSDSYSDSDTSSVFNLPIHDSSVPVRVPADPRLTDEALEKTVPVRSTTQIHDDDIPLAGYLLARCAEQRPIEDDGLELLRDAHDSMREARNLMPHGRGNVKEDVAATKGLSYRAVLHKQRKIKGEDLPRNAVAVFGGSGNCGEFAVTTAIAMAGRMKPQIKARMTKRLFVDHVWTEAAPQGQYGNREHTVILDGWRSGPAVCAPDGAHSSVSLGLRTKRFPDLEDRRHFTRELHRHELRRAKIAAQQYSADGHSLDHPESYDTRYKGLWKDKSGVNQEFARRAASRLDQEISPAQAYVKGEPKHERTGEPSLVRKAGKKLSKVAMALTIRSSREGSASKTLAQLFAEEDAAIEAAKAKRLREAKEAQRPIPAALRSEIQAVRVARDLAPEMKTADVVRVVPKIAEAARTLGLPSPTKAVYPYVQRVPETNDAPVSALVRSSLGSRREAVVEPPLPTLKSRRT